MSASTLSTGPLPTASLSKQGPSPRPLLIGCGHAGRRHARCLSHLGVDQVWLCDPNPAALNATRAEFSDETSVFTSQSLEEALDASDPNWIIIATPSGLHLEQLFRASARYPEAKILLEKPLGTQREMLDRLDAWSADRLERGRPSLIAVQPLRFQPALHALSELLEAKRLGTLLHVQAHLRLPRSSSYFSDHPWRGDRVMDGGPFLNQGFHYLDVLELLFGPLEVVGSTRANHVHDVETGDSVAALLQTPSGLSVALSITLAVADGAPSQAGLEVIGDRGAASLKGALLGEIGAWVGPRPALELLSTETLYRELYGHLWPKTLRVKMAPRSTSIPLLGDGIIPSKLAVILTDVSK